MVEAGEEVVITRRGKRVARLEKYQDDGEKPVEVPDFRELRRELGTDGAGGPNAVLEERASYQ